MDKLVRISENTCIGSEFLGIYNGNIGKIESSISDVEEDMGAILSENRTMRERLSQLSGNFQTLKNSYDALKESYDNLLSAFEEINDKLDDIINQE